MINSMYMSYTFGWRTHLFCTWNRATFGEVVQAMYYVFLCILLPKVSHAAYAKSQLTSLLGKVVALLTLAMAIRVKYNNVHVACTLMIVVVMPIMLSGAPDSLVLSCCSIPPLILRTIVSDRFISISLRCLQ